MRLTSVQAALLQQAENWYREKVASRGCNVHQSLEELAGDVLKILEMENESQIVSKVYNWSKHSGSNPAQ